MTGRKAFCMTEHVPMRDLPDAAESQSAAVPALHGLVVADFSRVIAGPVCPQTLADLGADVVKIENPRGGDETRSFRHPRAGGNVSAFLAYNRGKRSVAIDLGKPEGRAVALDIVSRADVLVENFRPGVMARLGLDHATVAAIKPRLVYCSISAYGRTGEFSDRAGYDPVMQAETGIMTMNGLPEHEPVRTNLPFVDMSTGMLATNMILAALMARQVSGRGQQVDVVLYDTAVMLTTYYGHNYLISGEEQVRYGHAPLGNVPIGNFRASDGSCYLSVGNDRMFGLLCRIIGRDAMASDPAYATVAARAESREALIDELQASFSTRSREAWVTLLKGAGLPAGPVRSICEAYRSPEIRARGLLPRIRHPTAGEVPNIAPPYAMQDTPIVAPSAPPLLGEHTEEVLRDMLGYDADRLRELETAGAIPPRQTGG